MKLFKYPKKENWEELLKRPVYQDPDLESKVEKILNEVKKTGDKALYEFSLQFDKVRLTQIRVSEDEISDAEKQVDPELKKAIKIAYKNILKFHSSQLTTEPEVETTAGVTCWRKSVPIEKIGLYIPGGSAPLFSTVLMLGIPARIAGCKNIVLCTPPDKSGNINPTILYTAALIGITEIYKIGGAQAIAAMGYGTESISKVYKIFGPGNNYVTIAKQLLQKDGVAIDMPAGPSEVAILADETAITAFVAADLLSQAEHGPDSQVLLITTSEKLIGQVNEELEKQTAVLPRKEIVKQALENSKIFLVKTLLEGINLLNEYAPEHLIIACNDAEILAEKVINAGSVFIGNYTPESAGDYASGTNHTLPTNGWAKSYSGVSVDSFLKKITFQKITKEGLKKIGPVIELMAQAEGLEAHKNAITIRIKK
jgi:histidinol dehydrogenase